MKYLERTLKGTESLAWVFMVGAMVAIVSLFLLVIMDIVARAMIGLSLEGEVEFSEYMLVAIAFLGLGYAQLTGTHVRVEAILSRFRPRVQTIINILILLLVTVLFIIMTQQIGQEAYRVWIERIYHPGMTMLIPTWPPFVVAFIGCILLILSFLTQLFRNIMGLIIGKVVGFKTWTP